MSGLKYLQVVKRAGLSRESYFIDALAAVIGQLIILCSWRPSVDKMEVSQQAF